MVNISVAKMTISAFSLTEVKNFVAIDSRVSFAETRFSLLEKLKDR